MQISDVAIEEIKGNNKALGRLCVSFDKHMKTIELWLSQKDIRLTTPNAVDIIKAETGLTEEEILVPDKVEA